MAAPNSEAVAFFQSLQVASILRALAVLVGGYVVAKLTSRYLLRMLATKISKHQQMLMERLTFYSIIIIFIITALQQVGFHFSVLLGAAGVLTLAVGFASRTSISNLISGMFLIFERPFRVGDIIKVSGDTGEVLSIDPLSIKLKTFDNQYVRIPNDLLIKTSMTNMTHFSTRRCDLIIGVAYKEDLSVVCEVLMKVAASLEISLKKPEPRLFILGFGDSAVNLQFSVWAKRKDYTTLKYQLHLAVKNAFDAENIEIPFPQISLNTGSGAEPYPIEVQK